MNHSLQFKLLISFMLVIIITLAAVLTGISLHLKEQVLREKQRDLIQKGNELAKTISAYEEENGNLNHIGDFLSHVDLYLDARIWVLDKSRQLVNMSHTGRGPGNRMGGPGSGRGGMGRMGGGMMAMPQSPGMLRPFLDNLDTVYTTGDLWTKTFDHPYYNEKMVVVAVPVTTKSGAITGVVVLNAPVAGVSGLLNHMYYYIGAAGLAAVLFALFVISWLTRSIIRPLKAMQQTASAMAHGNYNVLVPVNSNDEVGKLGTALNSLAKDLANLMAEIEKNEKARRDFVANVSHELRTPLAVIRGYHDAIKDGLVKDPEQQQKYHNFIQREIIRLSRLIQDLLDLSRLQAEHSQQLCEKVALHALVDNVVTMIKQQAEQKNVTVTMETSDNLPSITGNMDRLTQLLLILLDNAVKYTPAYGNVKVSTHPEGEMLALTIADTGVGIPAEDLPFIWERFYKVDKSHGRTEGGAGLGLAIAKQIIDLHQAAVQVTSLPGKGTVFKLLFKPAA
jgi:signal transduction histidine kinase